MSTLSILINSLATLTRRVSVTRVFMLEQRNFHVEAALTALTVTVVPGCGRGWGGAQPNMRKV